MNPLKINKKAVIGSLGLSLFAALPAAAAPEPATTFTTDAGNTVEVWRNSQTNDAGDERKRRAYRVTDENGDVVARGHDRARINADGSKSGAQRREVTDANGNVHQKRRRAQSDGDGNVRAQRHRRVKDADGNVTQRARSAGRKTDDGRRATRHQRQFTDANGRKTDVRRNARVDSHGNRKVTRRVTKR